MSETSEQAARRRWVTLAELIAVAGVLIAALTLWSNWSDRRADVAARQAETTKEARERARIDLTATVQGGGETLSLRDEKHDVQDLAVAFPRALGVQPQRPAELVLRADWFAAPLLKLTDGGVDERTGRLPVLLTVRYWDGDTVRTATAIYDVIWRTEGRMLRGRTLTLESLRLRERGGDQARLDAIWEGEKPA